MNGSIDPRLRGGALAPSTAHPWLVADIGGTNARFGLVSTPGGAVVDVLSMRCADFAGPEDAALSYFDAIAAQTGTRPQPRHAAFALATAIHGDTVKMTNSNWVISRVAAETALGAQRVFLFNDFEALALALPSLTESDVVSLGGEALDPTRTMAAIGPGTGLGVAASVPNGRGGWIALAGEGGHVSISAADDFEAEVIAVVRREFKHVSAERILSGIGLPTLHKAVLTVRGAAPQDVAAETITQHAHEGDAHCVATLDTFCAMLGGFTGNVALTMGARGGVFVGGGVAQLLAATLRHSRFRERFEAKGRFDNYLKPIATRLITAPHAALVGAAQGIANGVAS
jgi:glucokinase